jgi:hypothetical protein
MSLARQLAAFSAAILLTSICSEISYAQKKYDSGVSDLDDRFHETCIMEPMD